MEATLFAQFAPDIEAAAVRYSPVMKRYGWDTEDVLQQARLRLWQLVRHPRVQNGSVTLPYIRTAIMRHLKRRIAQAKQLFVSVKQTYLNAIESRGQAWVDDFVFNVLLGAPADVHAVIQAAIL